jgi:hypothetical protein
MFHWHVIMEKQGSYYLMRHNFREVITHKSFNYVVIDYYDKTVAIIII